ncbi:MAG: hypothetical protein HQK64_11415 [Desulfamplus sp.]|nr:hypothetical protein [Desulfamplus sp.]MBF0243067.1 hypothetical protein [Desulfamplus sp.]
MKKRPSLLDIELFAKKRADEKKKELLNIAEDSGALIEDAPTTKKIIKEQEAEENKDQSQNYKGIEELLTTIIDVADSQSDDINRLKQDMFKLKEELRVYHSFLSSQQKKIAELEKSISDNRFSEDNLNRGVLDTNYSKLLLKNIVWLKEERDFSSNDVARLFRAEGFQTPHPYDSWDEKVVNSLYSEAKKSFL